MMARAGLRIGVVGATGTLGTELLELLDLSSLRVSEIVPIATDRSLGRDIEFQGSLFPVETDDARLAGLDLAFLCAPPAVALEYVRGTTYRLTDVAQMLGYTDPSSFTRAFKRWTDSSPMKIRNEAKSSSC